MLNPAPATVDSQRSHTHSAGVASFVGTSAPSATSTPSPCDASFSRPRAASTIVSVNAKASPAYQRAPVVTEMVGRMMVPTTVARLRNSSVVASQNSAWTGRSRRAAKARIAVSTRNAAAAATACVSALAPTPSTDVGPAEAACDA